jgi:hypothetical protein
MSFLVIDVRTLAVTADGARAVLASSPPVRGRERIESAVPLVNPHREIGR